MIKRVVELLIGAALVYAAWHAVPAYLHYYQFNDAIGELALFAGERPEDELRERVAQLAAQYKIPLDPEAIVVSTNAESTRIEAPYTARVKLLPNYTYDWHFEPKANVWHVR